MARRDGRRTGRERGQALVEMALVMSMFGFLILGVVDIGRLFGTNEQLTNAVHEGAKVAAEYYSSYQSNPSGLSTLVENQIVQESQLNPNNITNLQITLQNPSSPDYTGEQIVQVSFQYKFSFIGPWGLVPGLTNPMTLPPVTAAEATR